MMISRYSRRWLSIGFLCLLVMTPVPGVSYVLPGSHILDLMTRHIREPKGLVVVQHRSIPLISPVGAGSEDVTERLWFRSPGRFRSELSTGTGTRIQVVSSEETIAVEDGRLLPPGGSPADRYTDILIFRDRQSLARQLESAGVDVTRSSLQRLGSSICFVVGNISAGAPASSLWVDRETLLPVRYIQCRDGWNIDAAYQQWKKVGQVWYPMEISVSLDGSPLFRIHVDRIELKSDIPDSLFDIEMLKTQYPEGPGDRADHLGEDVSEIQKSINDFSKLYE